MTGTHAAAGPPMNADPLIAAADQAVPWYLARNYWWAYVHPRGVRFFERQWLVNLILWGNFGRLRDAAIRALGTELPGRTLQISCVYGDLTSRMATKLSGTGAELHVVDVLRIQIENLARKLPGFQSRSEAVEGGLRPSVALIQGDSTSLELASASYERALIFFLLHEQPAEARRRTLSEALRVVKPGGRVVIVDYHRPHPLNPLYWPMACVLHTLEPFALDLWRSDIASWLPAGRRVAVLSRQTYFGGLYQLVSITV